jgi:Family of unknown function (DUF6311)
MGWLFFRIEPWRFPLGVMRGLLYPHGTTIGFTDSLPWVSVFCKLIAPVLPAAFHPFGLWLALCYALQAYMAAKIVKLVSPSRVIQVLGGVLYAISAPLVLRVGHEALCAHWMLLLAIWLHLSPWTGARAVRRAVWMMVALNVFAAGIHPYLAVMLLVMALALYVRLRLENALSTWLAVRAALVSVAGTVAVFYLFAYLGSDAPPGSPGFGEFSADLATFVNPGEYSTFFGSLPMGPRQYEGIAYLGVGVLGLAVFGAGGWISQRRTVRVRRYAPLVVACLALALFAFANPITWLGRPVLRLDALYRPFKPLVEAFRSSGRFIWPLHYLLVTVAVSATVVALRGRPRIAAVVLALAVALQARELRTESASAYLSKTWSPPASPGWGLVSGAYQHMALYPPMVKDIQGVPFDEARVAKLAYVAYRAGMTINSGYTARLSTANIVYAHDWARNPEASDLHADTVYVAEPSARPLLERAGGRCGSIDALAVCVRADRKTRLLEYLEGHP